jgi:hypothetical protein
MLRVKNAHFMHPDMRVGIYANWKLNALFELLIPGVQWEQTTAYTAATNQIFATRRHLGSHEIDASGSYLSIDVTRWKDATRKCNWCEPTARFLFQKAPQR